MNEYSELTHFMQPKAKLVLFFLEGHNVPASRFRVEQYREHLSHAQEISFKFLYTLPNKYLWAPNWLKSRIFRTILLGIEQCLVALQRICQIIFYAPRARVIFLQRDLLFRLHFSLLEKLIFLLASKARIVFDIDDAIFCERDGTMIRGMSRKLVAIFKRVDLVLASNQYLADQVKMIDPDVQTEVVPTVIDSERFVPANPRQQNSVIVLCWSGVQANLHYLENLRPVLLELERQFKFKLRIIVQRGTPNPFSDTYLNVEMCAWSQAGEVQHISSADIGLMPLNDDAWSRGKAGFKLLQYMSCGLAAVASPVGVNSEIVNSEQDGLLASDHRQWFEALSLLISDTNYRLQLGQRARSKVLDKYSLRAWKRRWLGLVVGE